MERLFVSVNVNNNVLMTGISKHVSCWVTFSEAARRCNLLPPEEVPLYCLPANDWRCYVKGLCHQNGFNIGPDVEKTCDSAVKYLRMTSFQLD